MPCIRMGLGFRGLYRVPQVDFNMLLVVIKPTVRKAAHFSFRGELVERIKVPLLQRDYVGFTDEQTLNPQLRVSYQLVQLLSPQ